MCEKTGAKVICSLEQTVYVLLNDKSRMKGDFQVRFREKFEVKLLLLTRLRGREKLFNFLSYSIRMHFPFLCIHLFISQRIQLLDIFF